MRILKTESIKPGSVDGIENGDPSVSQTYLIIRLIWGS